MTAILNKTYRNKFNSKNERIIKKYQEHLRNAFGADDKTLFTTHKSIRTFEVLTDFADLERFNSDLAKTFMTKFRNMSDISENYMFRVTSDVKKFIHWLANESIGKRVKYNDADYLNLTNNEIHTAHAAGYKKSFSYADLLNIVHKMPNKTIVDMRNQALISTQVLGSFRASELVHFRMDTIIYDDKNMVYFADMNPRKIQGIKFRKARQATLLNYPELLEYIIKWRDYLKNEWNFDKNDPLFPSISSSFNKNMMFEQVIRKSSLSVTTLRDIFKKACINAGFEPLPVHSIRKTRARFIENITQDELIVALKQDFGHSHLGTTRENYGNISEDRQRALMAKIDITTTEF
ncbi:site-specific integrase [bacterium]|nr:site-specific integrase [bacterium]